MQIVVSPTYKHLRSWIETIPQSFSTMGEVIYDARNQIRVAKAPDGTIVNIKRYHTPAFANRVIYSYFRKPKAERAYRNALLLSDKGIATPTPIGYILCGNHLLAESFLITLQSPLTHTFYDFRDGVIAEKEELICSFARWTAKMHSAGVLHKDYSPGNILYDNINGQWKFEVVDINRMSFGRVSPKAGAKNFCRLWGKQDFFEILSPTYAKERGIRQEQCLHWMLQARKKFWRNHPHEHFVTDDTFSVGVIISTYNNPRWLERALWGLSYQTHKPDEIVIADDGSSEETRRLIEYYAQSMPIRHVWHEDNGFRKTTILNKAVCEARADYLIFMDQDLIARKDFISQHYTHARKGRFISGGAILMPQTLSERITEDDIRTGNLFRIKWLKQHGMPWNWKMSKLWQNRCICYLMNLLTPTNASWNGGNSSTWREYIQRTNGFDTRMRYGAEDREFGQRLLNAGIKGIQLRYGTPLMHLYHTRPYRNEADWQMNRQIWQQTIRNKTITTPYGINKLQTTVD